MFVRTTLVAASGTLRAEVIERDDRLFEVMVFEQLHEYVPGFGVDEYVWHPTSGDKILTDTYERAVDLAREALGLAPPEQ